MPAGRPSTYDPSYCEKVIEWGKLGKSITWMAAELDISRSTIHEWIDTHPEFSDAINKAKSKAQAVWEDYGQNSLSSREFNAGVWSKSMAARFPEDWRDKQETAVTGAGGGAVMLEVVGVAPRQG